MSLFARPVLARTAAWLLGALVSFHAAIAHAEPQGGWWWNPAESGRGYFLEIQGPRLFFSAYFYGSDGRATWLVSNDPMPNPEVYVGQLLVVSGGQSLVGDYRAPGSMLDGGEMTLRFSDDSHGTLTWPGGQPVAIERYRFHSGVDQAMPPMTGWWLDPAAPGRGFSIELQGDHMFIGTYMYDSAGNALWYVADTLMRSPTLFRGPLLQFANGQTMTGPYRAPSPPVSAGTITVEFTDADHATVTLSDDPSTAGTAIPKQSRTIVIQPQRLDTPRMPRPDFLLGSLGQTILVPNSTGRHEVMAPEVTWVKAQPANLDGSVDYEIQGGSVTVRYSGIIVPDPTCLVTGSGSHQLQPAEGRVKVRPDGRFSGHIFFQMSVTNLSCGAQGPLPVPVFIPLAGTFNTVMRGEVNEVGFQSMYSFKAK